jgi:hypothetical protein
MGIPPVNLNYWHPEVGSDSEVGSRSTHQQLTWGVGLLSVSEIFGQA